MQLLLLQIINVVTILQFSITEHLNYIFMNLNEVYQNSNIKHDISEQSVN